QDQNVRFLAHGVEVCARMRRELASHARLPKPNGREDGRLPAPERPLHERPLERKQMLAVARRAFDPGRRSDRGLAREEVFVAGHFALRARLTWTRITFACL